MSLEIARLSLHSPKCPLTPFIILINNQPFKIYGDPTTMSMRTETIPRVKEKYITLKFDNIPFRGVSGFLYVWHYLNGLSEEITLLEMMKSECYYIAVPGVTSKPIKQVSKIVSSPIEAHYFLTAFGIPYKDHIWGKWFLGLFPLNPAKDHHNRILLDLVGKLPPAFIPPPLVHWSISRTPRNLEEDTSIRKDVHPAMSNRFDNELLMLIMRSGVPIPTIPPSMRRFAGEEIKMSDLFDEYVNNRAPYTVDMNRPRVFDDPFIAIVRNKSGGRSMFLVRRYELRYFPGGRRTALYLSLDISPSSKRREQSFWMIYSTGGGWYSHTKGGNILESAFVDAGEVINVSFYHCKKPIDHCDRLMENNLIAKGWEEELPLSDAIIFTTGSGELIGNPVVMASRSSYMLSVLEAGVSREKMHLDVSLFSPRLLKLAWNWMNGYDIGDNRLEGYVLPEQIWRIMNYFLIDPSSPLSDRCIFSGTDTHQKAEAAKILTEEGRNRMPSLNKLLPLSDIRPYVEGINKSEDKLLSSPFHLAMIVPESEMKAGDFAILTYSLMPNKVYRIRMRMAETTILDDEVGTILSLSSGGRWVTMNGLVPQPTSTNFLRINREYLPS